MITHDLSTAARFADPHLRHVPRSDRRGGAGAPGHRAPAAPVHEGAALGRPAQGPAAPRRARDPARRDAEPDRGPAGLPIPSTLPDRDRRLPRDRPGAARRRPATATSGAACILVLGRALLQAARDRPLEAALDGGRSAAVPPSSSATTSTTTWYASASERRSRRASAAQSASGHGSTWRLARSPTRLRSRSSRRPRALVPLLDPRAVLARRSRYRSVTTARLVAEDVVLDPPDDVAAARPSGSGHADRGGDGAERGRRRDGRVASRTGSSSSTRRALDRRACRRAAAARCSASPSPRARGGCGGPARRSTTSPRARRRSSVCAPARAARDRSTTCGA